MRITERILTIVLTMLFIAVPGVLSAKEYGLDDLVNPNIADRRVYVSDPAGLLNAPAVQQINERLMKLRQSTSAEMAVVVLPSIGDEDVTDFSIDLFEKWGLGKSDNDNGVLFLVVLDQKEGHLTTGYGVEGVLTDAVCATILREEMIPRMKEGDVDGAVAAVSDVVANVLSDPDAAAEIRSKNADAYNQNEGIDSEALKQTIFWIAAGVTIATWVCLLIQFFGSRRRDRYHRALMWHNARMYYLIAAVFSLGGALLAWLIVVFLSRRTRTAPRKCNYCGKKMHRLSEEEDNEYLSGGQDMEEKLNTVDYDVWKCDSCGAIDRYAFPQRQTTYSKCPRCGTVAMREVGNFTIVPPTTRRGGEGEKISECLYCKHQNRTRYRIPKKEDASAAAAALGAAAILGGRGGHGGGGGFGGGFGGGHTGGGGASGRW